MSHCHIFQNIFYKDIKTMNTPFATEGTEGTELYVRFDHTGITPIVAAIDGLPMINWENERIAYMKVTDVIDWYEKELGFDEYLECGQEFLEIFKSVLAKFRDGMNDFIQ